MKKLAKIALLVGLAVAAGLAIRTFGAGTQRIYGTSMENTLFSGDIALVTRFDALLSLDIQRGDVVLCRFPGRPDTYVKRVIGLPGEALSFEGGQLSVDGVQVPEPYVSSPTEDMVVVLGEDEYFVLGDNRQNSYDSRLEDMGALKKGDLLGRVRFVLWPLEHFGGVS